jgi:hypothetical protein
MDAAKLSMPICNGCSFYAGNTGIGCGESEIVSATGIYIDDRDMQEEGRCR